MTGKLYRSLDRTSHIDRATKQRPRRSAVSIDGRVSSSSKA
jgi:hypothetical protein